MEDLKTLCGGATAYLSQFIENEIVQVITGLMGMYVLVVGAWKSTLWVIAKIKGEI